LFTESTQLDISDIDFTPYIGLADYIPNVVFSTLLDVRNKIVLVVTGNRFGKTRSISRLMVYRACGLSKYADHNIKPEDKCRVIRFGAELLPEDKDNEVKNTVYPQLKYQLPSTMMRKDITARVPVITYQPMLGGSPAQFEFTSYGQSTMAGAGVDRRVINADEVCPYDYYEESMPRLATTNGQFFVGTTPVEAGWMHTEIYERAKVYLRTQAVRAFMKKQYGQTVKQVEKTDSKADICVIQAASDDNPIWRLMLEAKKKEILEGKLKKEDWPYDTVAEYLDSVFMYDDPDTVAIRRYGIFRQITGAVHKEFQWNLHMIPEGKYFPNGVPASWRFGRAIDYHQSVPWAIIFAAISPDDEVFIWQEMNPDPHNYTTGGICLEMMDKSLDYSYRVNLIDKLATEVQTNVTTVNRSAVQEINSFLREHGRLKYDGDSAFESWDDKTTIGEDRVRERLINSKICGKPFNNLQKINGKEVRLPTLWIFDECRQMGLSLKNWKMETWIERDSIITKDPKDKKENKWSHFNRSLECLLKDSRFRATPYVYTIHRERELDKCVGYFQGRR